MATVESGSRRSCSEDPVRARCNSTSLPLECATPTLTRLAGGSEGRQSICEQHDHGDHLSTTTRLDNRYVPRSFSLGTMSTGTVVPASAVVPIDVEIPFTSACIVGCGVMTGYGSVVNAARVKPGSSGVVLGCGGVASTSCRHRSLRVRAR